MVHYTLFPTAIGQCGIAWQDEVIVATQLPERNPKETTERLVAKSGATKGAPRAKIQAAIEAMTTLLEGNKTDLRHISCDLSGVSPFAREVYHITRAIPAGETKTYGDVAGELGDKQLAQKVGRELGRNPLPIIVPCHRVLGANYQLTGFSAHGGVETKLQMLMIEGARFSDQPGLFD